MRPVRSTPADGLTVSMFDLAQLRCFVVLAEELHFGRAAQRLNMTQPPLSRQLQVLEHIVGARLLDRTSRSVQLTAAGRSFLPEARRILRLAMDAAQVARRMALGKTGSIRIGFTASAGYSLLPELVAMCREHLPDVDLSLKEMVSFDQLEALDAGQMDIGLLRPPIARSGYDTRKITAEPLIAAVAAGHPFARHERLKLTDFDDAPFIMYSPFEARYFHDLLATQFFSHGVLPRYVQHLSQIHVMLSLVRAGLGLAIVPSAAQALRFEGVKLLPIDGIAPDVVELFMVWRRESDNPLLREFLAATQSLPSALAPR